MSLSEANKKAATLPVSSNVFSYAFIEFDRAIGGEDLSFGTVTVTHPKNRSHTIDVDLAFKEGNYVRVTFVNIKSEDGQEQEIKPKSRSRGKLTINDLSDPAITAAMEMKWSHKAKITRARLHFSHEDKKGDIELTIN